MPDVKMNYQSMENMEKAFHAAQQQVQESMQEMEKVAKSLEDGALLGQAGNAFKDAIRSKLEKRMKVIADQMGELERDINGALIATRDGITTATSRFK
jgi:uncharacterized protein YukE